MEREDRMGNHPEDCRHPEGLRAAAGSHYRCPACEALLDHAAVERWVREAERMRDAAYGVDGLFEELQDEVYRRRREMYEVRSLPGARYAGGVVPEMVLVSYDALEDGYECRIFYKAPRPVWGTESFRVGASEAEIERLRDDDDPTVRLASEKVAEFHADREGLIAAGIPAPPRRVFYAAEL